MKNELLITSTFTWGVQKYCPSFSMHISSLLRWFYTHLREPSVMISVSYLMKVRSLAPFSKTKSAVSNRAILMKNISSENQLGLVTWTQETCNLLVHLCWMYYSFRFHWIDLLIDKQYLSEVMVSSNIYQSHYTSHDVAINVFECVFSFSKFFENFNYPHRRNQSLVGNKCSFKIRDNLFIFNKPFYFVFVKAKHVYQ